MCPNGTSRQLGNVFHRFFGNEPKLFLGKPKDRKSERLGRRISLLQLFDFLEIFFSEHEMIRQFSMA